MPTSRQTLPLDQTMIEAPPGTREIPPSARPPSTQPPPLKPIQPARTAEKPAQRGGIPGWALAIAAVFVLVLVIGGGAVAFSLFSNGLGGAEDNPTTIAEEPAVVNPTATATAQPAATPTVTTAAVVAANPPTETPTFTPEPTDTPTPTPVLPPAQAVLGDSWLRLSDNMTMRYVPAGSFLMGSDPALDSLAQSNEQLHQVTLDAFWIDQTEVTNDMFAAFVADTDYVTTAEIEGDGRIQIERQGEVVPGTDWMHPAGPDSNIDGQGNYPVLEVSWFDAQEYCTWAGGGLPTEAQWAYAARGPNALIYPWGNEFDGNLVNFCDVNCPFPYANQDYDDHSERLAPVATLPGGVSWVGAFDMVGNVWEWVADWFSADYFDNSPAANPTGPETGDARVLRGGSWYDDAPHVRAAQRGANAPETRHALYGFRCALPVE